MMAVGWDNTLSVQGIVKSFDGRRVLDNVDLDLAAGELTCILGPSGCGKTTLLRIIAGLEMPDSGTVIYGGEDITRIDAARRGFGIVFQNYALFPNLTALQNVEFGLLKRALKKGYVQEAAAEALDLVGLGELADRYPSRLSGGEKQRVALARALAVSPSVLLLDEPLSALDARVRVRLRHEIRDLQRRLGLTTLMVTHDQEEALTMADRVCVMEASRIVQNDTPVAVYERPVDKFVADFIGSVNLFPISDAAAYGQKGGGSIAIRPEHVQVFPDTGSDGFPAVLKEVEFRGLFYRLLFRISSAGLLPEGSEISVDMMPGILEDLDLGEGDACRLFFPEKRILFFPDGIACS